MSLNTGSTFTGYDPLNPEHHSDPAALLERSRSQCPVAHPYENMLVVTRMDDVRDILMDNETYSARSNFVLDPANGARGSMPVRPITTLDPPEHGQVRQLLRRWMAPRELAKLEPRIRDLVTADLDEIDDRDTVDVLTVAKKLAAQVVYALLGMPEQDWDRLQGWTDAIHERLPFSFDDMSEFLAMVAYLDRLIAEQMALPKPDARTILGGLSLCAADGGLTAVDVRIHLWQLITAGTETTSSLITNLLYELLLDRSRWQRLLDDRSLIHAAVEESLRHDTPIQFVMRTPHEDTQIAGCPVTPGQQVVLHLQSANWDQQTWGKNAAEYDMTRRDVASHVAFGKGPHACLGAPIARLEARVLLEELLRRYPDMTLAPDYEWAPTPELMVRRPTRLEVRLR
jgi:cytochrome P450